MASLNVQQIDELNADEVSERLQVASSPVPSLEEIEKAVAAREKALTRELTLANTPRWFLEGGHPDDEEFYDAMENGVSYESREEIGQALLASGEGAEIISGWWKYTLLEDNVVFGKDHNPNGNGDWSKWEASNPDNEIDSSWAQEAEWDVIEAAYNERVRTAFALGQDVANFGSGRNTDLIAELKTGKEVTFKDASYQLDGHEVVRMRDGDVSRHRVVDVADGIKEKRLDVAYDRMMRSKNAHVHHCINEGYGNKDFVKPLPDAEWDEIRTAHVTGYKRPYGWTGQEEPIPRTDLRPTLVEHLRSKPEGTIATNPNTGVQFRLEGKEIVAMRDGKDSARFGADFVQRYELNARNDRAARKQADLASSSSHELTPEAPRNAAQELAARAEARMAENAERRAARSSIQKEASL